MTTDTHTANTKPAISDSEIIERFGGIRPMASKLGVAVTTVQGWKERGHIPEGRHAQIVAAAAQHGVDIAQQAAPAAEPEPAPPEPPSVAMPEPEPAPESEPEPEPQPVPQPEPEPEPEPEPAEPAAAAQPDAEKPAAAPPPRGGVSPLALAAVLVLLGGLILTGPLWQAKLYPGGAGGSSGVDSGRLDDIAASLKSLEGATADLRQALESGDGALAKRIGVLEAGGGESGAAFAAQLSAIEDRLQAIESGLAGIESRIAGLEAARDELPPGVQAGLDASKNRIGALEGEIGTLSQTVTDQTQAVRADLAGVGNSVADLDTRIAALESRPVQTGEKIAAMVLALGQVETGLNSGRPYRQALDRLMEVGRDDPLIADSGALSALSAGADSGIPDRLALRRRFAALAPAIDRALAGAEEGNWLDSVWNSVKGLVTIRRIEGGDLTPIGQAEQALERGDLATAAAAFENRGPLGDEGEAWLGQVKARLAAEAELENLYGQMISPLAGDGGSDGGSSSDGANGGAAGEGGTAIQ